MGWRLQTCLYLSLHQDILPTVLIIPCLYDNEEITCHYSKDIIQLTINMDGGKHLMYPLCLSKGCPACGKGKSTDPGIFFVKRSCTTTKKDGSIVARSSYKYCRGLLQVFSPGCQKILNVLQKVIEVFMWAHEKLATSLIEKTQQPQEWTTPLNMTYLLTLELDSFIKHQSFKAFNNIKK